MIVLERTQNVADEACNFLDESLEGSENSVEISRDQKSKNFRLLNSDDIMMRGGFDINVFDRKVWSQSFLDTSFTFARVNYFKVVFIFYPAGLFKECLIFILLISLVITASRYTYT